MEEKIAVVYWSGTGNTQQMAQAVAEGAGVSAVTAAEFDAERAGDYGALAFGCPSMGTEQLEESEFAPVFERCKPHLAGKRVALFGSYGWGDGEWMRAWEEDCRACGAELACESVICQDAPDGAALDACRALGQALRG